MSSSVRRILILSIKAGAGHMRAAEALQQAFAELCPSVEVRHIEALEYTNAAFQKSFTAAYNTLAAGLPSIWGYIYGTMEKKPAVSKTKRLATLFDRLNSRPILNEVRGYRPDRIICTHYFPAEILAACRRKGQLDVPMYVTLTDYDIHTMWIQEGVDHYFVATDEMAYALQRKGIGNATVSVTGIPIMPVFARSYPDRRVMRKKLGLRPDPATALVAAGGFGLGGVDDTVATLADTFEDVQLLAVAGRNEKLRLALEAVASSRKGRIVPFGFVTHMHELMAASDFAVTKSGGLTSSECLALGLPMLILRPIPGQEERNADYLLENGVAMRANSPAHLIFKIGKLLNDPHLLARMRAATKRIAKPRAAYDIAEQVIRGV
jgi:processive 1,2-diacylglycerol beta-glucosyltransferase